MAEERVAGLAVCADLRVAVAGVEGCQVGLVEEVEEHGANGEARVFAEDMVAGDAECLLHIHVGIEIFRTAETVAAYAWRRRSAGGG